MNDCHNRPAWVGVHLFELPTPDRALQAETWLRDNPPDIAKFKEQFPDPKSHAAVLPSN